MSSAIEASEARTRVWWTLGLGLASPVALFLALRIPLGCSVLNFLGLPWPVATSVTVALTSAVIVLAAITLVVFAFATRGLRWLGAVILSIWVVSSPVWLFVMFLSLYGDPGPTTCRP